MTHPSTRKILADYSRQLAIHAIDPTLCARSMATTLRVMADLIEADERVESREASLLFDGVTVDGMIGDGKIQPEASNA